MNEKKPINLFPLYFILGFTGLILILTGIVLNLIFSVFSIKISNNIILIFQAAFILSGLADFWLLKYAKDKLEN